MDKPKPPMTRHVVEHDIGPFCEKCNSSLKWGFNFLGLIRLNLKGCVNPDCNNYWDKEN